MIKLNNHTILFQNKVDKNFKLKDFVRPLNHKCMG